MANMTWQAYPDDGPAPRSSSLRYVRLSIRSSPHIHLHLPASAHHHHPHPPITYTHPPPPPISDRDARSRSGPPRQGRQVTPISARIPSAMPERAIQLEGCRAHTTKPTNAMVGIEEAAECDPQCIAGSTPPHPPTLSRQQEAGPGFCLDLPHPRAIISPAISSAESGG